MAKKNLNAKVLIALSTVALVAALAQAGCAPAADAGKADLANTGATTEQTAATEADPTDPTGPYVSDEACLAGSFEANAANTEKYGQWNPHSSIHGGYNSCDNCHEKGQEVTRNWCANCHTYSAEGSDYHEDSLFL